MNARKLGLIALIVLILVAMAFPTLAADKTKTVTVTLTETQINNSYRVTNPRARSITNVNVDLQPGQVVITGSPEQFSMGNRSFTPTADGSFILYGPNIYDREAHVLPADNLKNWPCTVPTPLWVPPLKYGVCPPSRPQFQR